MCWFLLFGGFFLLFDRLPKSCNRLQLDLLNLMCPLYARDRARRHRAPRAARARYEQSRARRADAHGRAADADGALASPTHRVQASFELLAR